MRVARRGRRTGRIEIIPMIDVVFFLLVFFMMASLSMTTARGLRVNLPSAASGESDRRSVPVTLTLTEAGGLYVDREPVDVETLPARLRAAAAGNPDLVVVVNADRAVEHGRVVAVMDAARQAGVARLAVSVAPKAPEAAP
ncbi:MAG TPA: biopolymer transporter ExbD [Thermodesulfobacteriota bacterium]